MEIDMMKWTGKLALDLIALAGLGYQAKALQDENSDFVTTFRAYGSVSLFIECPP